MFLLMRMPLAVVVACVLGAAAKADVVMTQPVRLHRHLPVYCWQEKDVQPRAAVLCLHGFPMHARTYNALASELARRGFIVYAPDMRGLGGNAHSDPIAYTTETDDDIAAIARCIRRQHKDLQLFVCGESMGGSFGLRLAAKCPDLLDGLIVSGPGLELCRHYLRLVPSGLLSVVVRCERVDFTGQLRNFFSADPQIVREILADPLVRRDFRVHELLQPKVIAAETSAVLKKVPANLPILVLQDRDDEMCRASGADLLRRELRTSDLTVRYFRGRGHVLLETKYIQSDAINEVGDWLVKRVR